MEHHVTNLDQMRICIIVLNSLRKDPRVIKQIRCAMEEGFEVSFVGVRDQHYCKKFLNELGCQVSIVDLGDNYIGRLNSFYKKLIRKFMHYYKPIQIMVKLRPDIIHANDYDTLIQAYIASKLCKSKILFDAHEIDAENITISEKWFQKRLITWIERFLARRVDAMVTVSNSASKYFGQNYKIPNPTVVANCPYKTEIEIAKAKSTDKFEVLYQGLMIEGRGYEEFVKSAKYLNENINLIIRGYGPIKNKLLSIIHNECLADRIKIAEPVEIREIISVASDAHLGVVLTQPINLNFEVSLSNKIFEYIHAGLPVLMSDLPEHRYLNEKYNFGIILADNSPTSIAKCINDLAVDNEMYDLLRNNAIKAAKILCWENESRKLVSLYQGLQQKAKGRFFK